MAIFTAFVTWATGALVSAGLSAVAAATIVNLGISFAISAIAGKFAAKVPRQRVQATINQAAAPRVRGYGLVKLGGVRALFEVEPHTDNLHQIIVSHHGPVHALVDFVVDGKRVGGTPRQLTESPWRGNMTLDYRDGSGDGGDYQWARDHFDSVWTPAHKLTGLATIHAVMDLPDPEEMQEKFPKGAQTEIAGIWQSSLVYNPATGNTIYTDNVALCIRDHLTDVDGWNIPAAWIDDASIIAFTGLCAQFVPLRNGGQERRYRVGGYYTLDEECKLTSQRLLATCDGQIHMTPEGKIGLMGGEWTEPDVTLGEDDIIEIELEDGRDPFTEYNVQKGIYIDPENDFTDTEVREWRDNAALATQPERVTEFEVDMCPSGTQLQRLMKIRRMRDRREWVGTIRTKLSGIKARFPKRRGAHIIRVVWPELDIDGPFEVTSWGLDPDRMECIIGIGSVENAWAWDAAVEEKLPPKKVSQLPTPDRSFAIPTGLVVQQQIFVISYSPEVPQFDTRGVQLVAFVDDPGRAALRPAFEYREKGSGGAWSPMSVTPGTYRGISDAVSG